MKMMNKRAYERPKSEAFELLLETAVLQASIDGSQKPVDDAGEGNTSGWGWN